MAAQPRCPLPFWEEVARISVTKGACGTEKRQKAVVFRRFNVNPSPASRELPLHKGAMSRCDFRLCAAEKATAEFKFSKLKVCTLFFCGSAVGHYEPSSGRKVSRVSVTEGARGTERRQIFLFLHRSLFPQRLPSFKEGSCRRRRLRGVTVRKEVFLWQCSASPVAFLGGRCHAKA